MSAKSADELPGELPSEIPLFPLGTVLFPGGLLPLKVFEQRYVDMTKACLRDNTPFGVCLIREGHEVGLPAASHAVGCLAHIAQWDVPHPNLFAVLARGSTRFRILDTTVAGNGLITAQIETLPEPTQPDSVDSACQEVLRLAVERDGVESVPGPVRLDDPVFFELLVFLKAPKRDWINTDPTSVFPQPGSADEFTVFGRERRIGFDGDEDPLKGHGLDVLWRWAVFEEPFHFIRHAMTVAALVFFFEAGEGNPPIFSEQRAEFLNGWTCQREVLLAVDGE